MVAVALFMVAVAVFMVAIAFLMVAIALFMVAIVLLMVAVAVFMVAVVLLMVAVVLLVVAVALFMVAVSSFLAAARKEKGSASCQQSQVFFLLEGTTLGELLPARNMWPSAHRPPAHTAFLLRRRASFHTPPHPPPSNW